MSSGEAIPTVLSPHFNVNVAKRRWLTVSIEWWQHLSYMEIASHIFSIYFVYLCACTKLRVRYWLDQRAPHISLKLNKLRQLCYILCRMLNIPSGSVRIVPFNYANALGNESMREYSHHSIQRILCPGQNCVGTYNAVLLKQSFIAPKLLLRSTNLAGIWSFTNDNQFTSSRILWNRVEELQAEKVWVSIQGVWIDLIHGNRSWWGFLVCFFSKNLVQLWLHGRCDQWLGFASAPVRPTGCDMLYDSVYFMNVENPTSVLLYK